jgi:hypothetical protein
LIGGGGTTPFQDTLPSELPLNLIIEKALRKEPAKAGYFGGNSFSGQPNKASANQRERTSRD